MLHRPNNLIETRLRKLTQLKVQPERVLKADYKIHGQFALPGTIPYTVGHCDLVLLVHVLFFHPEARDYNYFSVPNMLPRTLDVPNNVC